VTAAGLVTSAVIQTLSNKSAHNILVPNAGDVGAIPEFTKESPASQAQLETQSAILFNGLLHEALVNILALRFLEGCRGQRRQPRDHRHGRSVPQDEFHAEYKLHRSGHAPDRLRQVPLCQAQAETGRDRERALCYLSSCPQ